MTSGFQGTSRVTIANLVACLTVIALLVSLRAVIARPEPTAELKQPIRGLIDNSEIPPPSHFAAVQAFVIGVEWAALQPERGGPIVEGNAIDRGLAQARMLNARHPGLDLKIKLRVYAGLGAPEWVKRLGGAPVRVKDPHSGTSGTVGRFWTNEFGRAYDELQAKLAARYDQVPEIHEVVIARCATVFAEPFIRNVGDDASVRALLDAGFTQVADRRCHHEQIDAHTVWKRTRSALAFNPYQVVSPQILTGPLQINHSFTAEMMRYCRSTLDDRCILENNSIQWPVKQGYIGMYARIKELGPPIAFQTDTRARIGDLRRTLSWAVDQGANSVELFRRYEDYPIDVLTMFDRALKANAVMR